MRTLICCVLLIASCATPPHGGAEAPAAELATMESPAAAQKESPKKPKVDLVALEFSVQQAERRIRSGELAAQLSGADAEAKLLAARHDLELAQANLEHTENYTVPTALARAELDIDRSRGRLDDSKAELEQLKAMYKDEEFAESSKELVITRSERGVAQAERSLALSVAAREDLESFDLAKKLDDARRAVDEARRKLESAERRLEETHFGNETKAMEAAEGLRKAQKALAEGREKLEAQA